MVSKVVCTSSAGAIKYFESHLNVADYFTKSESVDRGEFIGKVAERLGLNEEAINREKFIAFAECDMIGLGADSKRQRASEIKYIEFTYSPPKAVSVVAGMDDRAKGELYAAVKEELRWFEQQVTVRDRRGNLAKMGREGQALLDVHVKRDLQPAELRSSQFYRVGDMVEYKQGDAVNRAPVTSIQPDTLTVEWDGHAHEILFRQVRGKGPASARI